MMKNENSKSIKACASPYYLGIDGGGTKTVFRLVDEDGHTVKEVRKGTSNPNDIGMEIALSVLRDGIAEACEGIAYSQITVFAGIAGGGMSGNNAEILRQFFCKFSFFAFENGSDIENLSALSDDEKRILVIMGTGFIVYAINGTKKKRIAGWGQLFDEGGSGYTIGKDAIVAVLSAGDGSGKQTILTTFMEEKIGETAEAHLAKFYQGGKRYIAEFASVVFRAAEAGDAVALTILENNMRFVAEKISTALAFLNSTTNDADIPVMLAGGISNQSEILFPLIEKHITCDNYHLIPLTDEPVEGAIRRARKIFEAKIKEGDAF
jgi:N-acetylglucosamine kinase-like BadF-type ATPase